MMPLSLLEIITIITALQLLLLGTVLMAKRGRQSNLILSLFMYSNALLLIYFLFSLINIIDLPPISFFYYLLGPFMYLYVRSLCEKHFKLRWKHWVHGVVFLGLVFYEFVKYLLTSGKISTEWQDREILLSQILLHVQIILYILASLKSIYSYRMEIKNHFSAVEKINLSWLLVIMIAFTAMWLTDFIAFIVTILNVRTPALIYALLVISIAINFLFANFIVFKGLKQPEAFSGLKPPEKYSGSRLTESESETMVDRIKLFMQEQKPFLNPDLSIKDLSEELELHQKYLSQLINSRFGQNFYDFVNHYRVQEAREIMIQNKDSKKTVLEILYEVGFNSKSAFNKAFKKETGKTPTDFRRTL